MEEKPIYRARDRAIATDDQSNRGFKTVQTSWLPARASERGAWRRHTWPRTRPNAMHLTVCLRLRLSIML